MSIVLFIVIKIICLILYLHYIASPSFSYVCCHYLHKHPVHTLLHWIKDVNYSFLHFRPHKFIDYILSKYLCNLFFVHLTEFIVFIFMIYFTYFLQGGMQLLDLFSLLSNCWFQLLLNLLVLFFLLLVMQLKLFALVKKPLVFLL